MTTRKVRAIRSIFNGGDVEIVPSIEAEAGDITRLSSHVEAALHQLAIAGIFPIRIVHGRAEADELVPTDLLVEARAKGERLGRVRTVERLKAMARGAEAAGQHAGAYALLSAAVKLSEELEA